MAFALWGTVGSIFNNNGIAIKGRHWDRSNGTSSSNVNTNGNFIWVDTATNATGYSVGALQTYTIYATAQNTLGETDSAVAIDSTAMIFPFLTTSGAGNAAASSVVFSTSNGVTTGGVIYWRANAVGGFDLMLQPVRVTASDVAGAAQALTLNGAPVSLMTGVPNLVGWQFEANPAGIVVSIAQTASATTRDFSIQAFNTSGVATTGLVSIATNQPNGTAFALATDGTNFYVQRESNTTPENVLSQTFNITNGALSSPASIFPTDWTDIYQVDARFAGPGTFVIGEGVVGAQHSIELGFFTSNGTTWTQVGNGLRLVQTNASVNHWQTTLVNGTLVLAYQDSGVVRLVALDQTGTQVGSTFTVVGITSFDRIRSMGDGRVEIDYRVSNAGDVQAMIFDMRTSGQTFTGTAGDDVVAGSVFDDRFVGTAGSDRYDGAAGNDTLDYSGLTGSIRATLSDTGFGTVVKVGGTDSIRSIENVTGTAGADVLVGNASANVLNGGAGNDALYGGLGDDTLYGGDGNDLLAPGAGQDAVYGGVGIDTVDYSQSVGGVFVSLTADPLNPTGQDGYALEALGIGASFADPSTVGASSKDTLFGIENVIGSAFDDRLYGSSGDNLFTPGAGSDIIYGLGGTDTVDYSGAIGGVFVSLSNNPQSPTSNAGYAYETRIAGQGFANPSVVVTYSTDTLIGIANVFGSAFDDRLYGTTGNNVFRPGAGNDIVYSLGGTDTVDYSTATAGVYVSLSSNPANPVDGNGYAYENLTPGGNYTTPSQVSSHSTDYLVNIANATGTAFGDRLYGTTGANVLDGGGGDDIIYANAGDDTLIGGGGNDILVGGTGTNRFVYAANWGRDTIADWTSGTVNILDFSAMATLNDMSGLALVQIGGATHINMIGDTANTIVLNGVVAGTLTTANFAFHPAAI